MSHQIVRFSFHRYSNYTLRPKNASFFFYKIISRSQRRCNRFSTSAPTSADSAAAADTTGHAIAKRQFTSSFDVALKTRDLQQCLTLINDRLEESSSRSSNKGSGTGQGVLDPRRHSTFIEACFLSKKPELALAYVKLLHPESKQFNVLLRASGKHRNLSVVKGVEAARQAAGIQPDSYSQAALITAYIANGQLADAVQAFHQSWQLPRCRTLAVCNAAIAAFASQGDWVGAKQALHLLRQAGVTPDIVTMNSLIKAAGAAGAMNEVKQLYQDLQADGMRPTTFTYTALFSSAAKNKHSDMAWLLQAYEDMGRYGVPANDYVLSSFFSAASYSQATAKDLDTIFAALALYRAHTRPNDTVFTSLLMLCTRAGIADRALDVWTAVQEDGVPFSPHLFSALFKACTAGSSPALVDAAMQAYQDMHMWWTMYAHKTGPSSERFRSDMLVAYNALLHFIGDMGQLEEALGVFEVMEQAGPRPDVVTYNTMIAAASHLGDTTTALRIFSRMSDAGVQPTEHTVGALLNAHAKARSLPSAKMIFDSLRIQAGVRPNVQIYTSLMDACVKDGSPLSLNLAFQLLDRMKEEGLQPTAVTYGCLLVACERNRDVDRAFQLYQNACDEGVLPTDECHNVLINVCTEAQRLEEALELVKRLARKHGAMQQHTMNSLTRALCPKYVDRALRMLSLTRTLGLKPTRRTYIELIDGCARGSNSSAAYQLYQSLRAQEMEADGRSGSSLITSLCSANQLELAVSVYEDMLACAWRKELQLKDLPTFVAHKGGLSKRAQVPDAIALAALTQAHAARGQMRQAHKYYKQLRRDGKGMMKLTIADRRVFELMIENNCRTKNVKLALQVFDDWKAASSAWLASQNSLSQGPTRFPKLGNVALAFLEACCRSEAQYTWRVYDVCAVMRQQKERKSEATLARPAKKSHHFFDSEDNIVQQCQ